MRWPWQASPDEEQEETAVERFDDVLDDDEQDPEQGDEAGEEEPELDDAQRAYVERLTGEREAQVRQEVRERLQAQGLDLTPDGAAIRDVNTFASKFGFGGQQQEQPRRQSRAQS